MADKERPAKADPKEQLVDATLPPPPDVVGDPGAPHAPEQSPENAPQGGDADVTPGN